MRHGCRCAAPRRARRQDECVTACARGARITGESQWICARRRRRRSRRPRPDVDAEPRGQGPERANRERGSEWAHRPATSRWRRRGDAGAACSRMLRDRRAVEPWSETAAARASRGNCSRRRVYREEESRGHRSERREHHAWQHERQAQHDAGGEGEPKDESPRRPKASRAAYSSAHLKGAAAQRGRERSEGASAARRSVRVYGETLAAEPSR